MGEGNDRTRWSSGSVPRKNRADFTTPNRDAKSAKNGQFLHSYPKMGLVPILAGRLREGGLMILDWRKGRA
jgi:hypothetical protein